MLQHQSKQSLLNDVYELVDQWVQESLEGKKPVINHQPPELLKALLDLELKDKGGAADGIIADAQQYLNYAVRTAHPGYLNQLFGGFNLPAYIGEVITAATNTSMYTYEVAPVATLMEMAVVDKMLTYTGWPSGNGAMMTGGSNTNMVAMLLARNSIFKNAKYEGITALPKLAILVSERAHFSMLKGANTIGIGQQGVVKVSLDDQGRMGRDGLEKAMAYSIKNGMMPFMVCSTAGTTETGSFDKIDEVSAFAKKHQLWHHVDGSWGGSLILSSKFAHLFDGLHAADSFSWNPHKLMNIPLICSVLLVRDPKVMREEIQSYDADYIYHNNDSSAYDLGPASLQCGRRVDSLKLWMAWRYFGTDGYAKRMEHLWELAEHATQIVENNPSLQLMFPTQSLNVNFRYIVPEGVDSDQFNESLRYFLITNGKAMVNYCHLENGLSIRLILLNADLCKEDISRFFNLFCIAAEDMLKQLAIEK